MDIKNYISSGILENYALGLLLPAEAREVERNLREFPELKNELNEIETSLQQYAEAQGITPPGHLRAKILDQLPTGTASPVVASSAARTTSFLSGALGLLFALAAIYAFYLYQQNIQFKEKTVALQTQMNALQITCDSVNANAQELETRLNILRSQFNRSVIMSGTEQHPQAIAAVHWNKEKEQNYLDIINLPKPPVDKQYQLWAIVDGTPVDMGVFDVNIKSGTFVEVPFIEQPQAFAITLEDAGGKPSPNLEQLYVIGNVT